VGVRLVWEDAAAIEHLLDVVGGRSPQSPMRLEPLRQPGMTDRC
jgi:hypothetical protein